MKYNTVFMQLIMILSHYCQQFDVPAVRIECYPCLFPTLFPSCLSPKFVSVLSFSLPQQNVMELIHIACYHITEMEIKIGRDGFYCLWVMPLYKHKKWYFFYFCSLTWVCLNQFVLKFIHNAYYHKTQIKLEIGWHHFYRYWVMPLLKWISYFSLHQSNVMNLILNTYNLKIVITTWILHLYMEVDSCIFTRGVTFFIYCFCFWMSIWNRLMWKFVRCYFEGRLYPLILIAKQTSLFDEKLESVFIWLFFK